MNTENKQNLNEILDQSAKRYAELPCIGMALQPALSYADFHKQIKALALFLREKGIQRKSRVAILAENSHNWGIAYLAIVRLGAVVVPILPDLPEADVHHILTEMGTQCIFISEKQIDKLYEMPQPPENIITLDDYHSEYDPVKVKTFSSSISRAFKLYAEDNGHHTFPKLNADSLAAILYTSGTSGFSKAVLLTHGNLAANAYSGAALFDVDPGAVFLSILPVSHTYEFTTGFILPLIKGCRIVYAGKTPTPSVLQKICRVEKPAVMMTVPLIMEKIYKKRVLAAINKSRFLSLLCRCKSGRCFIYRKIGAKLKEFFGGNLLFMGIGGAALNPDVETFLRDSRFPYVVGYGMTESSPLLAGGPPGDPTITKGSTGKPVPGVTLRIDQPDPGTGIGEIQAIGDNVMQGYHNDPEATVEAFSDDGWLRTGDLGYFDETGNLHIKGRSKSVIVLANGENIYPEVIEHRFNSFPFVIESLVLERNNELEVWIYPDYEQVDTKTRGCNRSQRHEFIAEMIESARREVNSGLPPASRLKRVSERREAFIKTATHKIKRYLYQLEPPEEA